VADFKEMVESMNPLHTEKSPHLEQDIDKHVDWYPWADQAFDLTVGGNKLIFLSFGYSTCHSCFVLI
jgi:uncharacterized protein YyaL (SSP411 family)